MKMTIALRLDPETREKLDLLAEASGYSPATLVAEAVRRFVDFELAALGRRAGRAGPAGEKQRQ
jgi:predicted transcriptional regulator